MYNCFLILKNIQIVAQKVSDFVCLIFDCFQADLELVERFEFYDRAKAAFAVVATGYVFDLFLLLLQKQCKMFKLLRKRFIVYWMSVNCSPAGALPFICNFYFSFSSVGLLYEKAYFRTERTNRFLLLYYCSHLSVNIDIGSEVTCQ